MKKVLDELKFRSEFLDERGRFQFEEIEPKEPQNDGRFGEFNEFRFITDGDNIQIENFNDNLNGLNTLLSEAVEKQGQFGEFTNEYKTWSDRVDELEKRIKNFGDVVIDENNRVQQLIVHTRFKPISSRRRF